MASTTCSIKPVKRSAGRSATAAAAYRAGAEIVDQRTGEVHDYTRKGGVVSAEIVAPDHAPEWAHDREALWNAAELAENRKNSQVAREFLIGLPHELDAEQRQQLAREFAQSLVDRYGFAVDVCIHAPDKDGDQRNHHAHILATTRQMGPDGLTAKTRELDDKTTGPLEVRWVRQQFEDLTNAALERAQVAERIDMRSYKAQGLPFEPSQHMGPAASAMERDQPGSTRIGQENEQRRERNILREVDQFYMDDDQIVVDRLEIELDHLAGEIETAIQALAVERANEQQRQTRQQQAQERQQADRRMVDKALEVYPCPAPHSTEHRGFAVSPLESWYGRLKAGLKGVAERARDYLDKRTHDAADRTGWTPEQIHSAGLSGPQADAGREALELAEQQRQQRQEAAQELQERQRAAIALSNETGHLYQPDEITRDKQTGEFRPMTAQELEPAKPEPDSLQAQFERRRAAREAREKEDEYQGPSMG